MSFVTDPDAETMQARDRLRRSEEQLQSLLDFCPALVGQLDSRQHFRFANEGYRTWFNLDPAEIVGRHAREIVGEDAYKVLRPRFEAALRGEVARYDGMVPYSRGGARIIHGVYMPHRDKDGVVDGLFIMAVDLTEQHRLADALAAEAQRSKTVLDTAVDGIITIDANGRISSANPASERMFGYTQEEMLGRNVSMLMPSPHHERHDDYIRQYLASGQKRIIGIGREVQGRRRNGEVFPMELAVGEFIEQGEHYFTGFTRDISDRKRAEQQARERLSQLAHVTRVSALGDLAAGLAHEVNQPLTAIVTTAQTCMRLLNDDRASAETLKRALEQIARQGERASNVIHGMRGFLRKADEHAATDEDIERLLRGVLELMQNEIRTNRVSIRMDVETPVPPVCLRAVQIEQVLLNILRNAIEAVANLQGIRQVTINVRKQSRDAIEVFISDNGTGIAAEIRERLFEPFVTTKPSGMGQGLSISRSIMRAHGGEIELASSDAGGSCFRLQFPASGTGQ